MNRLNFDSLENLNVPEEWIEKALVVPDNIQNKKPIDFLKLSRIITSVACVAVVSIVSLSLFFFTKNNAEIPIGVKNTTSVTFEWNQDEETSCNNLNTESKDDLSVTEPSEKSIKNTENITHSSSSRETVSNNTEPTEKSTAITSVEPQDTDSAVRTEPTETNRVTNPSNNEKTDPIDNTKPIETTKATESVEPSSDSGWNGVLTVTTCEAEFSSDLITGSGKVYCRLYDSKGNMIGDSNLFSAQHLASSRVDKNGKVFATYYPVSAGLNLNSGRYSFYFYNENGKDISQGYVYAN